MIATNVVNKPQNVTNRPGKNSRQHQSRFKREGRLFWASLFYFFMTNLQGFFAHSPA